MLLKTIALQDYEVARLLKNVNPLSMWGEAIHQVLKEPFADRLDELILELRSQAKDNPIMMQQILGMTIYNKLI